METATDKTFPKKQFDSSKGFSIMIPEAWTPLKDEELKNSFPGGQHPLYYGWDKGNTMGVLIGFDEADMADDERSFESQFQIQRAAIYRMSSGYREFGTPSKEIDGHLVKCMIYKANSPLGSMFNVTFFVVVNRTMVFGNFFCKYEDRKIMNDITLDCLDTLSFS